MYLGIDGSTEALSNFSLALLNFAIVNPSVPLSVIFCAEGKVTEVLVLNSGTEYNSPPQLSVYGEGSGCVLVPVMKSGRIDSCF